jgi:TIR domain
MARVFVSYRSEDSYFVDFLVELLKFHHVDVWVDRNDLHAGATFTSDIERALTTCDNLLVVLSRHSARSRWMTREISTFKASNPDRAVIPLVLDPETDVNEIYDGLGLIQHLRCYESLLESFTALLRLLGQELFPPVERRNTLERRSEGRRSINERRRSSIEKRLRVGIWKGYGKLTGKGELEPLTMASEVGRLARFLAASKSPLQEFNFVNRQTGEEGYPEFQALQVMAFASWRSKTEEDMTGAAYIIDDIIQDLTAAYVITLNDRRTEERREISRRNDEV